MNANISSSCSGWQKWLLQWNSTRKDVKRWLANLRGKDLPESFAWSYKRRFKTGYVWQDLLDNDLITPISDNEYILKDSYAEKKAFTQHKTSVLEDKVEDKTSKIQNQSETSTGVSTKSSFDIEEESRIFGSDISTLTDNSGKFEVKEKQSDIGNKREIFIQKQVPFIEMDKKRRNEAKIKQTGTSASSTKSSETCFTKNKSHSGGRSHKFRNLITCGSLDSNDSAVVMINRHNKPMLNMCSISPNNVHSLEMCKGETRGGFQRIFGTTWNQQHRSTGRKSCDRVKDSTKNDGEFSDQRTSRTSYNGPNCSQCGKQFKPKKLHAHMKSCKGIKALGKLLSAPVHPANSTSQRSIQFLATT